MLALNVAPRARRRRRAFVNDVVRVRTRVVKRDRRVSRATHRIVRVLLESAETRTDLQLRQIKEVLSSGAIALELGAAGVLLNTGVAKAGDPIAMASAVKHAAEAGRLAYRAGRMPRRLYASASSPLDGLIAR